MNAHDVSGNFPDKEISEKEVQVSLTKFLDWISRSVSGQAHQHQWAVLGVDYPKQGDSLQHPRFGPVQSVTFVLLGCHCGEPKSVTLDGHWSMSTLMMKIGEEVANSATRRTEGHPEKDDKPSGEFPPAGDDI